MFGITGLMCIWFPESSRIEPGAENAYVTEDGVTDYVAEDGSTIYVQET